MTPDDKAAMTDAEFEAHYGHPRTLRLTLACIECKSTDIQFGWLDISIERLGFLAECGCCGKARTWRFRDSYDGTRCVARLIEATKELAP